MTVSDLWVPRRGQPSRIPDLSGVDPEHVERFWSYVLVSPDPSVCWEWVGPGVREPWGHVRFYWWGDRSKHYQHRIAWLLNGGDLMPGEVVRHSFCDNGGCAQPLHMSAGSVLDNVADREKRDRRTPYLPRGADAAGSKLTWPEVDAIRAARSRRIPAEELAFMFDVSRRSIYNIWSERTYPQFAHPEAAPKLRGTG